MKTVLRKFSISVGRGQGPWLTLLLLLVVLVPSACLLWFMNQAAKNERLAMRQKLVELYRGHLSLARERIDDYWQQSADRLETQAKELAAPALFAKLVRDGTADAVICFGSSGAIAYPSSLTRAETTLPDNAWIEAERLENANPAAAAEAYARLSQQGASTDLSARALQAQARCLVRAGEKSAALTVLTNTMAQKRYRDAADADGRLIVPNALLMAIELLNDSAPEEAQQLAESLCKRLNDYDSAMPSPQRLFLMRELHSQFPGLPRFPTLAAEDLAAKLVETGVDRSEPGLRASSMSNVWQFASPDGRVVTLHRAENVPARLRAAMSESALPAEVEMIFVAPGEEANSGLASSPAGPLMQGWLLALSPHDLALLDSSSRERAAFYVWTGALIVAVVVVLALLALGMVRRQAALTQLRNDLVANVTHELKTPLSSMRLFVETLLDSPQLNEKTTREYLRLIATENLRLSRLIENFLTFSRIERNKYAFDFDEVPATSIAESAVAAVRDRFNAPGCQFEVRIPRDLPVVRADPDAMVTALLNLLDNAYKYSGESKRITFSVGAENGHVHFSVADNGIGLSPQNTKRVFKRFFQVNQHLSRSTGGAGIGLSIVQFIVAAHGGSVKVASELKHGSTFTITVPVIQPTKTTP